MIDQEKKQLRATVRSSIMQLTMGQRIYAATRVQHLIRGDADYQQARHIMAFWPLPDEVDIRPLLTNNPDGKKFYLPVVQGDDILVKPYAGPLQTGAFHILEPGEEMYNKGRVFNHLFLEPGCEIGWHIHHGDGETYYILKGVGVYNDDGTEVTVGPGDVTFTDAELESALLANGITVLRDEWVSVADDLVIFGREDAAGDSRKPLSDIADRPEGAFVLSVDHSPYDTKDIIESCADLQH